jgi:hypothetical protein
VGRSGGFCGFWSLGISFPYYYTQIVQEIISKAKSVNRSQESLGVTAEEAPLRVGTENKRTRKAKDYLSV